MLQLAFGAIRGVLSDPVVRRIFLVYGTAFLANQITRPYVPVLVERAMYFGFDGHDSVGVNAPNRSWYLPDGMTRNADTWLLLMNPNSSSVPVRITFLKEEGSPVVKEFTLKGTSRLNVFTNEFVPNTRFSIVVESDSPVVAERATYTQAGRSGDGKPGSWFLARRWYAAEGFTGHTVNLVAMNPGTVAAQTTFTLMLENGDTVIAAAVRHSMAASLPGPAAMRNANRRILLASMPDGRLSVDHFRLDAIGKMAPTLIRPGAYAFSKQLHHDGLDIRLNQRFR